MVPCGGLLAVLGQNQNLGPATTVFEWEFMVQLQAAPTDRTGEYTFNAGLWIKPYGLSHSTH